MDWKHLPPLRQSDYPRPPVSQIEIPAPQAPSTMILAVYNAFTMGISELFSDFTSREVLSQMFENRGPRSLLGRNSECSPLIYCLQRH